MSSEKGVVGANGSKTPRSVSRGAKLHTENKKKKKNEPKHRVGFFGIDSLYLVIEYPHDDLYKYWSADVDDLHDVRLYDGIEQNGLVLRRGFNGYKLSVWDGDARLALTDRVEDNISESSHGMGMLLQLGPKWLRAWTDPVGVNELKGSVYGQLAAFGLQDARCYPMRLTRIDVTIDVIGWAVSSFDMNTWQNNWVGYAKKKNFHLDEKLTGFSIGSSEGSVRFKVYDKVTESKARDTLAFWRSVWGLEDGDEPPVTRFEWTFKAYEAKFTDLRYLHDLTSESILRLLNYATEKWGRLCIPGEDTNQTRWELHPLWKQLRAMIDEETFGYTGSIQRRYDYCPDLKAEYLKSIAGWLAGLKVRIGLHRGMDAPASFSEALELLAESGYAIPDINQAAAEKWTVASRLKGGRK